VAFVLSVACPAAAQVQGGTTPGVPIRPPQRPAPPRDQTSAPATGTAKILGVVVASDDGRPLRRVAVRVTAPELREPRSATTDLSGRYEIGDLPAGRYTVTASRAGFVTISHGQTRPNEMGRPIDVSDGQTVERINFSLPRGAAITGRILDEYGEPVAGASVQAMQMRYTNGVLQPSTVFSGNGPMMMQTPDTGEFRVWGLAPGEYLIQASVPGLGAPFESQDRAGYTPTYYPNTTTASEAHTVRVEVGQTASGIEIVLTATRTARISGTTLDGRGQPLRSGFVSAMAQSTAQMFVMRNLSGQIKPDGTFTISGVTPGTYTVRASAPPGGPGTVPETLMATVTVVGDDVSGVVLTPLQPATISGRIVFEPPSQMPEASQLRLMVAPKDPGMRIPMPMPGGPPVVNNDFTFEAKAAPGETLLRVFSDTPGTQWATKSITVDGRDIANDGITLSSGAAVKGIEVVLTSRLQTIAGAVTNERGELATGVTVFVFPQNPERWFPGPMALPSTATARPDQNGRYSIRTLLPPGDYYAVAVDYLDPNRRGGDRSYLEELSNRAVRFSIREEESKALDLKISTPR
jgi:hypothetical protein